ncbi:hypothetical protein GCM10028824_04080 [Hymenobacter segetis]|uniref:DUF4349 domain-containing protein n=1 Tax=Hymenobacter segetis TaxID=2025509 RepID=A0ABU9LWW8_9BACT
MKFLIIPVLLGLGLAGCSQSKSDETIALAAEPATANNQAPASSTTSQPTTVAMPDEQAVQPEVVATPKVQPGHSVAYQAELNMEVEDFDKATDRINALLEHHGAYLGTAHETRADGQRRQEMTVKVPPAQFVALVSALGRLGHIENKDIASADITADVLATAAHLQEQQTSETQLRQQLARATSPDERTHLEGEIRRQRADAATTESQLQRFGTRADWATLTLHYFQVLPTPAPQTPMHDFSPQFLTAFYRGWSVVLELVVALTNIWPLLLLMGAGGWALRRWRQRQVAA